jgi:hypothetical protein
VNDNYVEELEDAEIDHTGEEGSTSTESDGFIMVRKIHDYESVLDI